MKRNVISDAIGNISTKYIQEAEDYKSDNKPDKKKGSFSQCTWKKAAAAVVFAGFLLLSVPSAAKTAKGFFQDIFRWDGAVIGLEYQEASDEVQIRVLKIPAQKESQKISPDTASEARKENRIDHSKEKMIGIPIEIRFPDTDNPPFAESFTTHAALGAYRILAKGGSEIVSASGQQEDAAGAVENGKAVVVLPVSAGKLTNGQEYILVVESVYCLAKADAPLKVSGYWECRFTMP